MKTTRRQRGRTAPIAGLVTAAVAVGAAAVLPATAADAAIRSQVTVSSQTIGQHGKVLVAKGDALYVLLGGKPCNSACLKIWPALTGSAKAGSGVQKSKLGVTRDSAGAKQVTYNGQPVYFFFADSKGTLKGNITDQWGTWKAVVVAKPKNGSGSTPTTSNSGANAGGGGVNF